MTTFVVVTIAEDGRVDVWGPYRNETRADNHAAIFEADEVDATVHRVKSPEVSS